MNIYLDDDSAAGLLAQLLRQAGHDVQVPTDAGLSGEDDAVHLTHAVKEDRILLTGNHRDFLNLHNLGPSAIFWPRISRYAMNM